MKVEIELTEYDITNVNTAMHLVPLPAPLAEIIAKVFYAVERLTPPKPEKPKEAIPHIHPHGISDCQFCAPTLTVNWKLTKHDHSEETKDCPASFCEFNMHPGIRKAFFPLLKEAGLMAHTDQEQALAQWKGLCLVMSKLVMREVEIIEKSPKESDPELALSVGQMKELFDNLVMEGFTKGEAARVVGIVARG